MKMKMKSMFLIGGLVLACQLLFAGMAGAATYDSSSDKYVNLSVPLLPAPKLNTGSLTFNTQQALYTYVVNPTGLSYQYNYYWVSLNGQPVLALDPMKIGL